MKKQLSHLLIGVLFIFGLTQCDYDRTTFDGECPDDSNPSCPCPNPSNPDCTTALTFDKFFPIANFSCGDAKVNEVLELRNDAGYMLAGRCDDKGFTLHIDNQGTQVICEGAFTLEPDFNFFTSIARTNSDRLITTGYTLNLTDNNTNIFNLLLSASACNIGDKFGVDNETAGIIQKWDHGNSIIADRTNNNIIVAGKWEGNPVLIRLTDEDHMGTSDIEDIAILDSTLFANLTGVQLASVNGFPIAGHELTRVIQTGDNGFLATGFVHTWNGTEYEQNTFLAKINGSDFSSVTLKMYGGKLPFKNTWGGDLVEVDNGNFFGVVGVGYNGSIPQALANANFPTDYPQDGFDGFILLVNNSDLSYKDHTKWVANNGEDFVTTIVNKKEGSNDGFLVAGVVNEITTTSKYTRIKDFKNVGGGIQANDIDVEYGESGAYSFPSDIIKTADGGYFIIINVNDINGSPLGIRVVKTDADGKVL